MILEGIVTSQNAGGAVNIAPMGPIVDATMETLLLRPFQTSTTYRNLKQTGVGVFHVTDDVLLLAKAAIGRLPSPAPMFPAERVPGQVLSSACRWYEFEVTAIDESEERTRMETRVVHSGRLRDFFGFNRAKHAVLEAAILATRVHMIPPQEIRSELARLASPVEKTGGPAEREAFLLVKDYVEEFVTVGNRTPAVAESGGVF